MNFSLLADKRVLRSIIFTFLGIAAGTMLYLFVLSGTQQNVVIWLYLITLLIAFGCGVFLLINAFRGSVQLSSINDGCSSSMSVFWMELACGVLVGLFAILCAGLTGCKTANNAFSGSVCPTFNSSIAFGIMTLPFYLLVLLADCGCIGKNYGTSRRQSVSAPAPRQTSPAASQSKDNLTGVHVDTIKSSGQQEQPTAVWPPPAEMTQPADLTKHRAPSPPRDIKPVWPPVEQVKEFDDE